MSGALNATVLVKLALTRKPEQRAKTGGGFYSFAKGREGKGEGSRLWAIFAFGDTARAEIDRLDVGDELSVRGDFDAQIWSANNGPQVSLKIKADVATPLKPPPRQRKRKADGKATAKTSTNLGRSEIDDPLPF